MTKQLHPLVCGNIGNHCVECLKDTSFGTGLFVNRIPADRDVEDEDGNWLGQRDGWLCALCNRFECDRCGGFIDCDEDITAYDVYAQHTDFHDGAYRVHEECLTPEEKELLEVNF